MKPPEISNKEVLHSLDIVKRGRFRAIHRGCDKPAAGTTELTRNLGKAQSPVNKGSDLFTIDAPLTASLDTLFLRLSDAFGLALSPKVRFKFSEDAQHIEERLARRR